MRTFSLTSDAVVPHDWKLEPVGSVPGDWAALTDHPLPATVPGEVHTDLLAAGSIPDPFDGDNETLLQWIGRTDWRYRLAFDWQPGGEARHDLVAEGLDTFATVELNGTEIARTANMHRGYRFDVTEVLRPGTNELVITFAAPATAAEEASEALGPRPAAYSHPFNAVRKMASSYGWDWGPDLAGAGIWKPIRIESWDTVRLAGVRPLASVQDGVGVLQAEIDLEWLPDAAGPVRLITTVDGRQAEAMIDPNVPSATLRIEIPEPRLWWPRGHGDQPLYPVSVRLGTVDDGADEGADDLLDRWDGRVGFRNVELAITPDAAGTAFTILVNDKPVYVKGYNWIPDDAFLTRLDADRYRASIMDAYESGANLLRVWGGGIYESDYFYTVCDELGILVWQDFLFACAAYSEDEPLWSEVEAEARQAITRLSAHPSLAVWNGNNENIWGYVDWGWRRELGSKSWGNGYYRDLLPKLVAELDPRTPYSAASPFSFSDYLHPNDPRHGSMHIWDVWNQVDYSHYRDYQPRFVSEFGFQGPPAWSTLTSVVHDQPLDPYGPQMLVHQKAGDGNLKLERGLGDHLPHWRIEPEIAIDDWHWLTQLNQARAVRFGIEHFRSLAGRHGEGINSGAVVWQLNDNWPVISWAAVDYAGIRKPLWHALKGVFADRLLTFQPRPDDRGVIVPTLFAHNDTDDPWTGELLITRRSTAAGSEVWAEQRVALQVEPRSAATILLDAEVLRSEEAGAEFLEARIDGVVPAYGYFTEDPKLQLAAPAEAYQTTVEPTADGYRVTVRAAALIKDMAIFPDRLDPAARVDSALITLRAGDSHTFVITGGGLDEAALTAAPVLRSVNDLITDAAAG
jgi:beta-mannosidase